MRFGAFDRVREWRKDLDSEKEEKRRECMTFLVHLDKITVRVRKEIGIQEGTRVFIFGAPSTKKVRCRGK